MPTPGAQTKLWMGSATNSCVLIDFISESVKRRVGSIDGNALKGTRSRSKERVREGLRVVNGQVTWNPQTTDLATMLPYIMGDVASGTSYPLGETPSAFEIYKLFGASGNRFVTFAGMKINQATFTASSGGLLTVTLDVVGLTAAAADVAGAPTVTLNTTTTMFTFHDAAVTLGGNTRKLYDFTLTINNAMVPRWINSRDADSIYATDRIVTIAHNMPEDQDVVATYEDTTVAVVLTFTANSQSLSFTMPAVRYDVESIMVPGRMETMMPLTGIAYKSGSSPELATVLDSTP